MALVENIENFKGDGCVVNQFVITIGSNVYFQSYKSIIARVDAYGNVAVSSHWDYSNTTRKYFYKFLREYTKYNISRKAEMLKLLKKGEIKETLDWRAVA